MLIFVYASVIIVVTVALGILIALGAARLDNIVNDNQVAISNKDIGFNQAVTLGHKITVEADLATQLKEARVLAAKQAAALPRGANMGVGRLGDSNIQTAGQRLFEDPLTAVKIAAIHGWDGARTGAVVTAPVAAATPMAAPAPTGKIKLVPGKDYPVIEVTDGMTPDEKRKARIANAKAKSAAMKAAKAARETGAIPAVAPVEVAPVAAVQAAPVPALANMPEPPTLVELTDDMSPDEKRKTRIANSKAKSAYNKALKAAGLDPKAVAAGTVMTPAAMPVVTPAATPVAAPAAAAPETAPSPELSNIPKPEYIELSDDMSPDEKRKARIHNSKARSAYNKALKAAGIDPKTVKN